MQRYQMSFKDKAGIVMIAVMISGAISLLFYHSWWGMLVFPMVYLLVRRRGEKEMVQREKKELREQFMYGLQVLNSSLQAGFSLENGWKEVEKEVLALYSPKSIFCQEVCKINRSVALSVPIEALFLQFAQKYEVLEIISFAQIMDFGKKNGGNWKALIEDTVFRMLESYETQKEIEVMIASKKLEQQIMNVIPLGMLLFLQISSWEYVAVLYETQIGGMIMTVCLVVYVLALLLSEKIMKIQV